MKTNKPVCVFVITFLLITTVMTVAASEADLHELTGTSTVVLPDYMLAEVPEITKVILPASNAFDFVLDPQGLSQINEGESVRFDELDAGRVFSKIDIPAIVLNEGSVPVEMTVEITATSSAGGGGNTDKANFIETDSSLEEARDAVFDGDNLNVLLYIVPSGPGITSAHDGYDPAGIGYIITQTPTILTFYFPEAEYTMTDTGGDVTPELVTGTGNGTQLIISGYINKNANWINFTSRHQGSAPSSIGLTAVFNWQVADDTQTQNDENEAAHKSRAKHLRDNSSRHKTPISVELDEDALNPLISDPADISKTYLPVGDR